MNTSYLLGNINLLLLIHISSACVSNINCTDKLLSIFIIIIYPDFYRTSYSICIRIIFLLEACLFIYKFFSIPVKVWIWQRCSLSTCNTCLKCDRSFAAKIYITYSDEIIIINICYNNTIHCC